jgi:hypothetical protein
MKLHRSFLATNLIFSLVLVTFLTLAVQNTNAQSSNVALQRGYRTGYSDGYMDGYRDIINNAAKSYERHDEYAKADRAYIKDYGAVEDYRDGYQQGFEIGYNSGFDKRSFDAALPASLTKRGVIAVKTVTEPVETESVKTETQATIIEPVKTETQTPTTTTEVNNTGEVSYEAKVADDVVSDSVSVTNNGVITNTKDGVNSKIKYQYPTVSNDIIVIPADTELIVELLDAIDTEKSREGDKFKARVISPSEISGAIIEGRIDKMTRPGRIKRRAEILLSFDRIILTEERWSNFNAVVTDVLPSKGDNVKRVDTEGTVEGKRPYKKDAATIGAATGTGLIVGAIAGGPVGAGVGAAVGAAFGVGAVVVDRGENINLRPNQQIRIKSAYETQIR